MLAADGHAYYGTQNGRIHKIDIAERKQVATFALGGREINGTFCYDKGFRTSLRTGC